MNNANFFQVMYYQNKQMRTEEILQLPGFIETVEASKDIFEANFSGCDLAEKYLINVNGLPCL